MGKSLIGSEQDLDLLLKKNIRIGRENAKEKEKESAKEKDVGNRKGNESEIQGIGDEGNRAMTMMIDIALAILHRPEDQDVINRVYSSRAVLHISRTSYACGP